MATNLAAGTGGDEERGWLGMFPGVGYFFVLKIQDYNKSIVFNRTEGEYPCLDL